jgi:general transcription factor 3C polypeptide 3 (transcription factor C subunit 4)
MEGLEKTRAPRESRKDKMTKADQAGQRKLTRAALENQMRLQMQELWAEVQVAEVEISEGKVGALDAFIQAAGTMVENFRLARNNFLKNRVRYGVIYGGILRLTNRV